MLGPRRTAAGHAGRLCTRKSNPRSSRSPDCFALLGIGEPFARDLLRIASRNLSFGLGGVTRFGQSLRVYAANLLTPNRVIAGCPRLGVYLAIGGFSTSSVSNSSRTSGSAC